MSATRLRSVRRRETSTHGLNRTGVENVGGQNRNITYIFNAVDKPVDPLSPNFISNDNTY